MKTAFMSLLGVGLCFLLLGNETSAAKAQNPGNSAPPKKSQPQTTRKLAKQHLAKERSAAEQNRPDISAEDDSARQEAINQILEKYEFDDIYDHILSQAQDGTNYNRETLEQGLYMLQTYLQELGIAYPVRYPCTVAECLAHLSRMKIRYYRWQEWRLNMVAHTIAEMFRRPLRSIPRN